jgi:hypothetical protein
MRPARRNWTGRLGEVRPPSQKEEEEEKRKYQVSAGRWHHCVELGGFLHFTLNKILIAFHVLCSVATTTPASSKKKKEDGMEKGLMMSWQNADEPGGATWFLLAIAGCRTADLGCTSQRH